MFELHHLSAQEQWDWLQRGEITPVELTRHYLDRIERLDGALGAFVTVTREAALVRAASLADTVPKTSPLWGLPIGDKDLVNRAGVRTGYGSRLMDGVAESSMTSMSGFGSHSLEVLDLELDPRGHALSAGQKQQLCLGRALLRKPLCASA